MIRVLLADDHNLFREGIISLLKDSPDIIIVGEAEDGRTLEKKFFELMPDVIVSDINMPIKSGPEAASTIINKFKEAKILFLSQYLGDDFIYSILKAGGLGLISKNSMRDELVNAIKVVNKGKQYFVNKSDIELAEIIGRFEQIEKKEKQKSINGITNKQFEILNLIGEGLTTEQISIELKISKRTVETHRYRMMNTLGFNSVGQLIRYAVLKNMKK
ncbi:MAG: response regulator transcription factor [Ignavibacteriae bacterium]|nr:response regulator transcription factor [Ignavibacteriota bacterium]